MRTFVAILLACVALEAAAAEVAPDLTLRGVIGTEDHQTYRLAPFDVPEGVEGIRITFDYSNREARTTIDVGLLGPGDSFEQAFRGWSGGNKRSFELSRGGATPSYLSGPVTPGRWNLLLGVPNIRAGQTSEFTAEIYFDRGEDPHAGEAEKHRETPELRRHSRGDEGSATQLRQGAGWYRGDLHMHSGHSDGSCASRSSGQRVPCPLFLTLQAAADRGLDFIAVTEHNTTSHVRDLAAWQPYFDRLLLIPGMELTTFQGHANAFNVTRPVDFRVGGSEVPDWNALLSSMAERGALVSINHPNVPSGESCMGCGWTPRPAADLSLLQAVEVVNGYDVETPQSGIPFWSEQLQNGHRLTAVGGSDTHDVTSNSILPPPRRIGVPTTVVHAEALGVDAILDGIRAGRVFVDTAGTRDRMLEFSARTGNKSASMGGDMALKKGEVLEVHVRVAHVAGGRIELIRDGVVLPATPASSIQTENHQASFTQPADGGRHWLRVNVRDRDGRLVLIGNPIYINWRADP